MRFCFARKVVFNEYYVDNYDKSQIRMQQALFYKKKLHRAKIIADSQSSYNFFETSTLNPEFAGEHFKVSNGIQEVP